MEKDICRPGGQGSGGGAGCAGEGKVMRRWVDEGRIVLEMEEA